MRGRNQFRLYRLTMSEHVPPRNFVGSKMVSLEDIDFSAQPYLTIIRDVAGDQCVLKIIEAFGGTRMLIPKRFFKNSKFVNVVGIEDANKVISHWDKSPFPGSIDIPTGRAGKPSRRIDWDAVVSMHDNGIKRRQIARDLGCTERHIRNILRQELGRREDVARQKVRQQRQNKEI